MNKNKLIYNELLRRYYKYIRKRSALAKANKNFRRQQILTKHIERLREQLSDLKISLKRGTVVTACMAGAAVLAPNMTEAQSFLPPQVNTFGLANWGDGYNNPTFADLDNDGDLDMLVGEFYSNFLYYENTGSNTAPAFAAPVTNAFNLTPTGATSAAGLSYFSAPMFVDLDNDGDFDVMSTEYYYGDLYYYENTGTNSAPSFAAVQVNPFGIASMAEYTISQPTFADLDNDGDLDMMVGDDGTNELYYYENTGTVSAPAFAAPVNNPFGLAPNMSWINATFIDIDGDADYDLFLGESSGEAVYFENTGTVSAPAFAAGVINPFGLTTVGSYNVNLFQDLDGDGLLDCMAGDQDGDFTFWKGCAPDEVSVTISTPCAYESPNGGFYTATGVYTENLTNSSGCDSIVTINLTIAPFQDLTPDNATVYACNSGETATVNYGSSEDGVMYWLRDNTNDTLVDGPITGDGNAIAFTTGAITTPMTYNVYAEKDIPSGGLAFHGSMGGNERVDCGNDASVQLSGTQITLEAWINPQNWVGINQGHVINKEFNGGATNDFGYMIRVGSGGDISFNLGNGNWNELTTMGAPLALDQWQHVAATYDGAVMQIYLNGTMVASQNTSISFSAPNNNLTIGAWAGGGGSVFDGMIDEVRVWNVSRSATQIQEAMDSCLTGTETGLVAYFQLEDGAGSNTATDLTANGNDGTLTNMDINADWVAGVSNCASCSFELTQTVTASVISIDNSVTNNNNVLTAGETGASYQWLDCDNNNAPINGETMQSYTATANGNFSIEITVAGCADTSACEAVTTVGLDELAFGSDFKVYPNPSAGLVNVDFGDVSSEKTLKVLSPDGKEIFTNKVSQQMTTIDMTNYPNGIYFLEISDGTRKSFHKIVKK